MNKFKGAKPKNPEMESHQKIVSKVKTETKIFTWTVSSWLASASGAREKRYELTSPILETPLGFELQFGVWPDTKDPYLYVNIIKGPTKSVQINFAICVHDTSLQPLTTGCLHWKGWTPLKVPSNENKLYHLKEPFKGDELIFNIKVTVADKMVHQSCDATNYAATAPGRGTEFTDSNLRSDIGNLLNDTNSSDVTLQIDQTHEYPAHRLILAARSSVFAAMFRKESKFTELNLSTVPIYDVLPEVMPYFLEYVYTGSIAKADGADDSQVPYVALLIAAEKYALNGLKRYCEEVLGNRQLCYDNVCELVLLADRHSASYLKRKCIEFIKYHKDVVIQSKMWRKVAAENSSLFSEVMSELVEVMRVGAKK